MKKSFFKPFLFIILVSGLVSQAHAQGQRMEGLRIAFVTQDLALTSTQAEKFWPTFNEYSSKRKGLQARLKSAQNRALGETTDAEIYAAVDELVSIRRQEADLLQDFIPKFKTVLTAKQIGKLVTLEKRMAREIMQRRSGGARGGFEGD